MTSPWMVKQRTRFRAFRTRHVDLQLQQLERARRRLLNGDVDVLVLGDSGCLFGAAGDVDSAMIPELISRELGGLRVVALSGAGYSARIHADFLRVLGTLPVRPRYLVTSVCVRTGTSVHVTTHPTYSYEQTHRRLAAITSAKHRISYLQRKPPSDTAAYEAFHAQAVTTRWGGDSTIGAFRAKLKGQGPLPWAPEVERTLFDYFHGEVLTEDHPRLADWEALGREIAAYGVPAVSYRTVGPIERGEVHFPGEFEPHVHGNIKLVDQALESSAGRDFQIVGGDLVDEDYADSRDGTEHFALSGRLKLARAVASALRDGTD
jgi:hypothetical protein